MPRSTREWAQRKLVETKGNLDWAVYHLGEVVEVYDEAHPELTKPMLELVALIVEIEQALDIIRESF
ncbi:hypothetical protein ES708_35280 [subsurface metagenome]